MAGEQFKWDDDASEDPEFVTFKRVGMDVRSQARSGLATWWSDKLDAAMVAQLGGTQWTDQQKQQLQRQANLARSALLNQIVKP